MCVEAILKGNTIETRPDQERTDCGAVRQIFQFTDPAAWPQPEISDERRPQARAGQSDRFRRPGSLRMTRQAL